MSQRWCKTTTFLMPALHLNFNLLNDNNFDNAYLADADFKSNPIGKIFIKTTPENVELKNNLHLANIASPHYHSHYEKETSIIYVFNFPIKFINEYKSFLLGKYSNFSSLYVETYFDDPFSIEARACRKENSLKEDLEKMLDVTINEDMEFWSSLNFKKEILNYTPELEMLFIDYLNIITS